MLKVVEHTYIGEVLVEIHAEMSKLIDQKCSYVLKECFK